MGRIARRLGQQYGLLTELLREAQFVSSSLYLDAEKLGSSPVLAMRGRSDSCFEQFASFRLRGCLKRFWAPVGADSAETSYLQKHQKNGTS